MSLCGEIVDIDFNQLPNDDGEFNDNGCSLPKFFRNYHWDLIEKEDHNSGVGYSCTITESNISLLKYTFFQTVFGNITNIGFDDLINFLDFNHQTLYQDIIKLEKLMKKYDRIRVKWSW